jgi:lysophospholipase L1-like esterase
VWRSRPFSGQYINVDDQRRRVVPNTHCDDPAALRVYTFGGSTLWGYGVPDGNTIPANLQALYQADGVNVCIVNYADFGFNSTQGLIQLLQLIQAGDIPDVALFYDGVNDVTAANRTSTAGAHFFQEQIAPVVNGGLVGHDESASPAPSPFAQWLRSTATYRLIVPERTVTPNYALPPLSDDFVNDVAQIYLANVDMAQALAERYDFRLVAVLQPALPLSGRTPTAEEQGFLFQMPGGLNELFLAAYAQWSVAVSTRPYLHDLSRALDEETAYVMWIDFNHMSAWGNLAMADRLYRILNAGEQN